MLSEPKIRRFKLALSKYLLQSDYISDSRVIFFLNYNDVSLEAMSIEEALDLIKVGKHEQGLGILKKLAAEENIDGMCEYGYQLYKLNVSSKSKEAFFYLESAANSGSSEACNKLGAIHKVGWNTPKSLKKATEYFRKVSNFFL